MVGCQNRVAESRTLIQEPCEAKDQEKGADHDVRVGVEHLGELVYITDLGPGPKGFFLGLPESQHTVNNKKRQSKRCPACDDGAERDALDAETPDSSKKDVEANVQRVHEELHDEQFFAAPE